MNESQMREEFQNNWGHPDKNDIQHKIGEDIANWWLSQFQQYKASLIRQIEEMKQEEFIEAHDNDGHRYQIPKSKREEWYKWCEIPSDDESSWDVPEYAERIDGMPVKENRGYNKCLEDIKNKI